MTSSLEPIEQSIGSFCLKALAEDATDKAPPMSRESTLFLVANTAYEKTDCFPLDSGHGIQRHGG